VGALIESDYPVLHGVLRRKDQHGCLVPTLAQRGKNIDAVAPRQHEIEQQKVEGALTCEKEAFLSGRRNCNLIVLSFETLPQRIPAFLFVHNNQNAPGVLRLEGRSRIGIIYVFPRRCSFLTKISGTLQWWEHERRARSVIELGVPRPPRGLPRRS